MAEPDFFPAVRCEECDALYGHKPDICRDCQSESLAPEMIDGNGKVYATTTIRAPGADHQDESPFVIALVDVGTAETVRVTARIDDDVGVAPTDSVAFVECRSGVFYFRSEVIE